MNGIIEDMVNADNIYKFKQLYYSMEWSREGGPLEFKASSPQYK